MSGKYIWDYPEISEKDIEKIIGYRRCSSAIASILVSRGMRTKRDIEDYLYPDFSRLSSPFEIKGIDIAVQRIWKAIHAKEHILIFGDYDTDGVTASALLYEVLRDNGAIVSCFLPHRFDDGYGMTVESLGKALGENNAGLIITVDCGISATEAVELARQRGIDVIITDHHEPSEQVPDAFALIDPKLDNKDTRFHIFAGVGVAFKLADGFLRYGSDKGYCAVDYDLQRHLDLVALGTVADLVPLTGENRILVHFGLQHLSEQIRPGINALCQNSGIKSQVKSSDITYSLSPRLNAAGRLKDATLAFKLLVERNHAASSRYADEISRLNYERQRTESEITKQVLEIIKQRQMHKKSSIIACGKDWNLGVIGIVASKIAREYNRPTIIFSVKDGIAFGSARSVENLNILEVLSESAHILERYGGHTMAAGLAIKLAFLDEFVEKFENSVEKKKCFVSNIPRLKIDAEAEFSDISLQFFNELSILEPYGYGNPEPVFLFKGLRIKKIIPVSNQTIKGTFFDHKNQEFDFVAFNTNAENFRNIEFLDIAATPQINNHRASTQPQLHVIDFKAV